jgi:hypothetical protein
VRRAAVLEQARQWLPGVTDVKAQFKRSRSHERVTGSRSVQLIVILLQTMVIPILLRCGLCWGNAGAGWRPRCRAD